MNERGVFTFVLILFLIIAMLIFIFALIAPLFQGMTTNFFVASQPTLQDANLAAAQITDSAVKAHVQGTFAGQYNAVETNIDILGFLHQFSWAIIAIVITIILFLKARTNVEAQGSGYY